MNIGTYIPKVEAVQVTEANVIEVAEWCGGTEVVPGEGFTFTSGSDVTRVVPGIWAVRGAVFAFFDNTSFAHAYVKFGS
jgi:hypothetical protein